MMYSLIFHIHISPQNLKAKRPHNLTTSQIEQDDEEDIMDDCSRNDECHERTGTNGYQARQ